MKKMRDNEKEMSARILTVLSLQLASAITANVKNDFTASPEGFKQIWDLFGERICNSKMEFFQLEALIAKELAVLGK
jgi:hypothetical protein